LNILKFTARRLAAMGVILLIVSFLVFSLLALTPGDPAVVLLGPTRATPEAIAKVNEEYGLDRPFVTQYLDWVTNAVTGDFGTSIRSQQDVTTMIADRVGVTAALAIYAFVLTVAVAVPLGLLAGSRQGSATDRAATTVSLVALATPSFAVGFLLIYVFAVRLEWFPAFGSGDGFLDRVWHLTLPALALALSQIAIVLRQTRAATVDVTDRDYVTFAKARAVPNSRIWTRYTLHNASLPVLTSAGLVLAYSLTGAVLIENVFALQGLGTLLVTSVAQLDLPVVQALALFTAVLVLMTNLVVDVLYFVIDPRLRRSASQPA
jgi:peptide/nickel transport system permease protein